jgi:thiamine-phosphate pyrophosphorylase
MDARDVAAVGAAIVAIARGSATRVLINDRVDVALACGADGVHLRMDSIPPAAVRAMVPRGFLVGQSVHRLDEAIASASHVDYLTAGTVWPSASKPDDHPLLGLDGFAAIASAVRVPVIAIGGVTAERAAAVAAAGGSGLAAIGLFIGVNAAPACRAVPLPDIVAATRARFDSGRSGS